MEKGLNIIWSKDKTLINISYNDLLSLEISKLEFAQIAALHIFEEVSMAELCRCYQEQYLL